MQCTVPYTPTVCQHRLLLCLSLSNILHCIAIQNSAQVCLCACFRWALCTGACVHDAPCSLQLLLISLHRHLRQCRTCEQSWQTATRTPATWTLLHSAAHGAAHKSPMTTSRSRCVRQLTLSTWHKYISCTRVGRRRRRHCGRRAHSSHSGGCRY